MPCFTFLKCSANLYPPMAADTAIAISWISKAMIHPDLINQRFAYVSVSRASHEAHIYTNHAASLTESLSHDVSKASAVEFGKSQNPIANAGLEELTVKNTPAVGLGMSL